MMINLTQHPIVIGSTTIPPSGTVARVSTVERVVGEFNGVPVIERSFGEVVGLPEEGTPCIVSAMVASAAPGRKGVFAPDTGATAIRDEQGRVVAVTRLVAA